MSSPPPEIRTRAAFLDESLSDQRRDPHVYLLAAAVCDQAALLPARDAISALKLRGQLKLHWHSESDKRRQLLYELDQLKVATATFESRGPKDDQRDRRMLDALRSKQHVSARLRITHVAGPHEPMLWIADAICGAIVQHRTGDQTYLDTVRDDRLVRIIEILAR